MSRFVAGIVVGIVLGMMLAGGTAYAQTFTGQAFNGWEYTWQLMYTIGWHMGFNAGVNWPVKGIQNCINKWTYIQTQAVIENYVRANPQEWHEGISPLTLRAVIKACSPP